ncbi:arylsulfatase [Cecembia sp.]|uniref:arylsulfatase n=1 Tax=Cecembia sp. TaxID=1898110 RepID=UPI0025C2CD15|nr:arylsulfatase [Cecembia sp.]
MRLKIWIIILSVLTFLASCQSKEKAEVLIQPNVIFILADDLGYGDLGFLGQEIIETPHLDKLAAEGMFFSNHYSGATVCAPSRSALMTGLHTGHTPVRGNFEMQPEGQYPLPDSLLTIPKLFKNAGYATGAYGKWGLGFIGTEGDPNHQGIDQFFGYNCQRIAHRYYPEYLWENENKVFLPGNDWSQKSIYAPEVIHQESLKFIEENAEYPFFMFVPTVMPHAELAAPDGKLLDYYRKKIGEEEPHLARAGSDYGDEAFNIPGYQSNAYPKASYAAMVALLDSQVGEILAKLDELGLTDSTIIIFTSDNGPHLEGGNDADFFNSNGVFRGYKRDLYEGGIRVPMIIKWPGVIEPGTKSAHVSAFWDFLPTFADLLGKEIPDFLDGISLLPSIMGDANQKKHDYLYWEFHELGGRQAIRKEDWKAVKYGVKNNPDEAIELFNLKDDPSESWDIADQHPELVKEMQQLFEKARTVNPVFKFFPEE